MRVIVIGTRLGDVSVKEINGTLNDFQRLVEGYIQPAAPAQLQQMGIEMLVNEEGLLTCKEPNANLWPFFYVGPAVLVGIDKKGESFIGLIKEQIDYSKGFLAGLGGEYR